jgi:hypothetical protein
MGRAIGDVLRCSSSAVTRVLPNAQPKAATRATAVGVPDKSQRRSLAILHSGKTLPHAVIGFRPTGAAPPQSR